MEFSQLKSPVLLFDGGYDDGHMVVTPRQPTGVMTPDVFGVKTFARSRSNVGFFRLVDNDRWMDGTDGRTSQDLRSTSQSGHLISRVQFVGSILFD